MPVSSRLFLLKGINKQINFDTRNVHIERYCKGNCHKCSIEEISTAKKVMGKNQFVIGKNGFMNQKIGRAL